LHVNHRDTGVLHVNHRDTGVLHVNHRDTGVLHVNHRDTGVLHENIINNAVKLIQLSLAFLLIVHLAATHKLPFIAVHC